MITDVNAYIEKVDKAAAYIRSNIGTVPGICIVLGSGLGPLAEMCDISKEFPYQEIPEFPVSTAPGHAGKLIVGKISGKDVFLMSGRFHYYEGYDLETVTFYVRVMAKLGVKTLFLTNAAGGISEELDPPELMVITDHLSFFADSALRGPNLSEFGVRFPDQSHVYDEGYIKILERSAAKLGITLHRGVYAYSKGPQYETPAEIQALKMLGVSAVGMSTVPEAIVAVHSGMKVAAVSCISNLAAGLSGGILTEEEVITNANKASENSCNLVKEFISAL